MTNEKMIENTLKLFKVKDEFKDGTINSINGLLINHSADEIYNGIYLYCEQNKRPFFPNFKKVAIIWIDKAIEAEKAVTRNNYSSPEIEMIIEGILETMEYIVQRNLKNPQITTRKFRNNYKRLSKLDCEKYSQAYTDYRFYEDGAIEIEANVLSQFSEYLRQILEKLPFVIPKDIFFWYINKKSDILRVIFCDFVASREARKLGLIKLITDFNLISDFICRIHDNPHGNFDMDAEIKKTYKLLSK